MSHSQILVTWNFNTNFDFVPWTEEKLHIGVEFQRFPRNKKYVRIPGKLWKLWKIHFQVPYFNKKTNIVPRIGGQWHIKMYLWQFSRHPKIYVVCGNLLELQCNVKFFLRSREQSSSCVSKFSVTRIRQSYSKYEWRGVTCLLPWS